MHNVKISELLGTLLLLVPAVALISANGFYLYRSLFVNFVPYTMYTLQDHFDKAVDFLIPIFVATILMIALIWVVIGLMDWGRGKNSNTGSTVKKRRLTLGLNWIIALNALLTCALLYFCPPPFYMIGLFGVVCAALVKALEIFSDKRPDLIINHNNLFWVAAFGSIYALSCAYFIMYSVHGQLAAAKVAYLVSHERTLIDSSSVGWLVIDDGRYKVIQQDGSLVANGPKILTKSKSPACRQFEGVFCLTSRDFEKMAAHKKEN
jgi:hypothetical protein